MTTTYRTEQEEDMLTRRQKIALWWNDIKGNGHPESMHPIYRIVANFLRGVYWICLFLVIFFCIYKTLMYFAILTLGSSGAEIRFIPVGILSLFGAALTFGGINDLYYKYKEERRLWKLKNR